MTVDYIPEKIEIHPVRVRLDNILAIAIVRGARTYRSGQSQRPYDAYRGCSLAKHAGRDSSEKDVTGGVKNGVKSDSGQRDLARVSPLH
jgi:hypothetical protein